MKPQIVVVTGASAGIGRAVATAFGARGATVGLIARGRGRPGRSRPQDVEQAGGTAVVLPADVADPDQVVAAVERMEAEVRPDRRVGERRVHLGVRAVRQDHARGVPPGHRGHLPRLRLRHAGGAAADEGPRPRHDRAGRLGAGLPGIPLQTAYCGAKHAIQGFHEALRCELLHEKSNVHVTMVQMPAVNTPQFSWVLSRLPRHPQPVPPIYQPETVARNSSTPPTTRAAGSTGWGRRPWPRWPPTRWRRACSTATSARPASTPSRPSSRTTRDAPGQSVLPRRRPPRPRLRRAWGVRPKSRTWDPQLWASRNHGALAAATAGILAAFAGWRTARR